jgi:hypothetical protein
LTPVCSAKYKFKHALTPYFFKARGPAEISAGPLALKHDFTIQEDIYPLADTLYGHTNQDDLLSLIFNQTAKVYWEHHFSRWHSLSTQTIHDLFTGPITHQAKLKAASNAHVFQMKTGL